MESFLWKVYIPICVCHFTCDFQKLLKSLGSEALGPPEYDKDSKIILRALENKTNPYYEGSHACNQKTFHRYWFHKLISCRIRKVVELFGFDFKTRQRLIHKITCDCCSGAHNSLTFNLLSRNRSWEMVPSYHLSILMSGTLIKLMRALCSNWR